MQRSNQNDLQTTVAMRHRTLFTLWIAMVMSIVMYYVFSLLAGNPKGVATENRMLTLILMAGSALSVLLSQVVKQRFLNQSIVQQRLDLVQTGYVVGFALSEVAALLGLVDIFIAGDRYYYLLMLIGIVGMALHWPRRDHILAACYKGQQ